MGHLRPFFATGALALALACSGPSVRYDYDAQATFSAYRSFAWEMPPPGGPGSTRDFNNTIVSGRVQRAVETELASKGFREQGDSTDPDFLVRYYPVGEPSQSHQVHLGLGFGMGPLGIGIGAPVGDRHREAVAGIVLEIQDGRSGTVVWKATAEGALQASDDPQEANTDVKDAVHSMLKRFPPKGQ
ncbi:MAG: DUF4136 domain-containing protein [Holophaga sp.]|jgi:hypothetical protein